MFNGSKGKVLWTAALIVSAAMLASSRAASAGTVFHYSFPDSWGGTGSAVIDQGPESNDGTTVSGASLSSDVPTVGVPDGMGTSSHLTNHQQGIRTDAIDLLNSQAVAAAGGFTLETWFKYDDAGSAAYHNLLTYTGTEGFYVHELPAGDELVFRSAGNTDVEIPISSDVWHYAAMVFDTQGNPAVADPGYAGEYKIEGGLYTFYLDSLVPYGTSSGVKNGYGDSLDRSIGVGRHPTMTLYNLNGLLYEPRVTLGVLGRGELQFVPEPGTSALLILGAMTLLLPALRRRRR